MPTVDADADVVVPRLDLVVLEEGGDGRVAGTGTGEEEEEEDDGLLFDLKRPIICNTVLLLRSVYRRVYSKCIYLSEHPPAPFFQVFLLVALVLLKILLTSPMRISVVPVWPPIEPRSTAPFKSDFPAQTTSVTTLILVVLFPPHDR